MKNLTRDFFVPKNYEKKISTPKLWDIYYMTKNLNGRDWYVGMYFGEKRSKPDAHYRFETIEQREKYTEQFMLKIRTRTARRNTAREERKKI